MTSYRYYQRDRLPKRPGIYLLQKRYGLGWGTLYVGLSKNVWHRWARECERQHEHLEDWRRGRSRMRLVVLPCWECNLRYREAAATQKHRPSLNDQRPKPEKHWTLLVLAEDVWRSLPWLGVVTVVVLVLAK